MSRNPAAPERSGPILISGKQFLGTRDTKKLAALFAEVAENEKAAVKLLAKTARAYYDAGNILAKPIHNWKHGRPSAKAVAEASGFPERRIAIALRIFSAFENNPSAINGLDLRDALKLIAPPPPSGEDGYNRVDLGGDPGQLRLDFGELFEIPATGNRSLQNYRTVSDLLNEIVVVKRDADGGLISKCFSHFYEDVPQKPALLAEYKEMVFKTQAAIEDYLAAVEQEEAR